MKTNFTNFLNSKSLLTHCSLWAFKPLVLLAPYINKASCASLENRLFYSTPSCRILDNSDSQFIILHEGQQIVLSRDFIEWFRGFTDAEGCFLVANTGNTFAFRFLIKLHVDDVNSLNFIRNSLGGVGNVTTEGSVAYYKVTSQKEIKLILEIFDKYPLNSSKHLDFIAFRRALYFI